MVIDGFSGRCGTIHMTDELASLLRQPDEGIEKRQCVTKAIAAGVLRRCWARQPSLDEVDLKAQAIRLEQVRQALDAVAVMGAAQMHVAPIEAEMRVYTHDIVHVNHDKDFRSHAVFPVSDLEECRLVVIRADYRGEIVIEMVNGTIWHQGGWLLWTFIWKGHMVLLEPPWNLDVDSFLHRWHAHDTPALGFLFFWHSRHDQEKTSPGTLCCKLCRPSRKAGEAEITMAARKDTNLAAAAIVGCIRAGVTLPANIYPVRGKPFAFRRSSPPRA